MIKIVRVAAIFTIGLSLNLWAQDGEKKIRYKDSKRIDFESLLIEGESKKPEMSVVTGNIGEKDLGLLKYRKDFNDFMADDAGENIQ